jgi:hypothetical protein
MNWKLVKSKEEYDKYAREFFAEKSCYDSNYLEDTSFKHHLEHGKDAFPLMVSFIQTEYCHIMDNQSWECVWFSCQDARMLLNSNGDCTYDSKLWKHI